MQSNELPPGDAAQPWTMVATTQGDIGIAIRGFEVIAQPEMVKISINLQIQKDDPITINIPRQWDIFIINIQ